MMMAVDSRMEHVPCNLCGGGDATPIARPRGYRIVRCRPCGLVYLNPRPPRTELLALYDGYHGRRGGDEASWNRLMEGVFREASRLLAASRNGAGPGRLLDVGCGYGGFVAMMAGRGWKAEGVDPSPAVVEAAARRGWPVRRRSLEEQGRAEEPYDAVTMFYVLEHLSDPMGGLRRVLSLLSPGGILLLRVPHTTPLVRLLSPLGLGGSLYDPPFHLYDFSPGVLRAMLEKAGFTAIRTFPGRHTTPSRSAARIAAALFGRTASFFHRASGGAFLLPGVSKTTVARKPA